MPQPELSVRERELLNRLHARDEYERFWRWGRARWAVVHRLVDLEYAAVTWDWDLRRTVVTITDGGCTRVEGDHRSKRHAL